MAEIVNPEVGTEQNGYVKQVWEDGVSPVNAERLNHMEDGIAQAGVVVTATLDLATQTPIFKPGTFATIQSALFSFKPVSVYLCAYDGDTLMAVTPLYINEFLKDDLIIFNTIGADIVVRLQSDDSIEK